MKAEIVKLVGAMTAAYPNTQVPSETVKVYVAMLEDIPLDVLRASIEQTMAESDFIPSIAKIREKARALTHPTAPEALEAWGIVLKEIRRTGFYRTPHFDNPIIAKAVDCIGWQTLCSSENQVADRAHFGRIYENLLERETQDTKLLPRAREIRQQAQETKELGDGRRH